jgi:hypothetical protein
MAVNHTPLVGERSDEVHWYWRCCGRFEITEDQSAALFGCYAHISHTDKDAANEFAIDHDMPEAKYVEAKDVARQRYGNHPGAKPLREAFVAGAQWQRADVKNKVRAEC